MPDINDRLLGTSHIREHVLHGLHAHFPCEDRHIVCLLLGNTCFQCPTHWVLLDLHSCGIVTTFLLYVISVTLKRKPVPFLTSGPGRRESFCLNVHIKGVVRRVILCLLLSISTVPPRILHAVACVTAPSLTLPARVPEDGRATFFAHGLPDGHRLSPLWTTVNNAAMNSCTQSSVTTCFHFSWAHTPVSGAASHVVNLCLNFKELPNNE